MHCDWQAKELLLGLTGSPVAAAAAAAGGSAAVQPSRPSTAGIQRIQLPATEVDVAATAGMAGMPPMSPKHRQPKPSAQPTDYADSRAVPPHDMYPPIQVMVSVLAFVPSKPRRGVVSLSLSLPLLAASCESVHGLRRELSPAAPCRVIR